MAVAEKALAYEVEEDTAETELESDVQAVIDECATKLDAATTLYQKQVAEMATTRQTAERGNGAAPLAAEVVSRFFGVPYSWWNLLMLGPFQRVTQGGPYRPSKIIRYGEPAFMIAALWRNPNPMPGGPSPAEIMAPFRYRIRGEVLNLSNLGDGPDFQPKTGVFGGGFKNVRRMWLPEPAQAPTEGKPILCEANFTVDVLGVGPGLPPFAGFSTWLYDPDTEPPFVIPQIYIPGVGVVNIHIPGVGRGLQHDTPARYMYYV